MQRQNIQGNALARPVRPRHSISGPVPNGTSGAISSVTGRSELENSNTAQQGQGQGQGHGFTDIRTTLSHDNQARRNSHVPRNAPMPNLNHQMDDRRNSESLSSATGQPLQQQGQQQLYANNNEARGRQYQIPMRYNIERQPSPSVQLQQQIQQNLNNSGNIFKPNYALNAVKQSASRDPSQKSIRSDAESLRRRVHSPFMHIHNKKTNFDGLMEFKRHSISGMTVDNGAKVNNTNCETSQRDYSLEREKRNKAAFLNVYNDNKVLETVVTPRMLSRKSLVNVDSLASSSSARDSPTVTPTPSIKLGTNGYIASNEQLNSIASQGSLISMVKKGGVLINNPSEVEIGTENSKQTAELLEPSTTKVQMDKLDEINNKISDKLRNNDESFNFIAEYEKQKMLQKRYSTDGLLRVSSNVSNMIDNSSKYSKQSKVTKSSRTASVDLTSSEDEDDNDEGDDSHDKMSHGHEDGISSHTDIEEIEYESNYSYGAAQDFISRIPMRTQQRQLAIKDLTYERGEETTANGWLALAKNNTDDDNKKDDLERSIENLQNEDKYEDNGTNNGFNIDHQWNKVSISQRNKYEQITNDLRKFAMFNKKPMINAIERFSISNGQVSKNSNASYIDEKGQFKLNQGRDIVMQLWNSAVKH